MSDVAADPYRYFRIEAQEILDQLKQGVLDVEKRERAPDLIPRLLRLAHTLKGAARVVKLPQVAEAAHTLEDRFTALRESPHDQAPAQVSAILQLLDGIQGHVDALSPAAAPTAAAASHEEATPDTPLPVFRPAIEDMNALLDAAGEAQNRLTALHRVVEHTERTRHLVDLLTRQLTRSNGAERVRAGDRAAVSSAAATAADVRTAVAALERECVSGIDQLQRELTEVRRAAERLRLVPARAMFTFLERAVRDLAQATGKPCTFEGRGGDVRLDATILGALQGALLHAVRNAVVHGIEPNVRDRQALGKPAAGRVTVEIARHGDAMSVVCADDGRGIDLAAVRDSLRARGRSAAETDALDDEALTAMLLQGGISTSARLNDMAGRGVGLDAIREAAARIGARLTLRTRPREGTSISIVFPFAIGSFQALLVMANGTHAAIPLDAVRETFRATPGTVSNHPSGATVTVDGRPVPYANLHRLMQPPGAPPPQREAAAGVVVHAANGTAAFGVDRVLSTQPVLARALPELAPAHPFVWGTAMDGDGYPLLVLDAAALVTEAARTQRVDTPRRTAPLPILIVDDSLTTRMLEQSILESAGYRVVLASSAEEGLVTARQQPHALFLVDVEMPGMDGFAFIEHVRADPRLADTPAILVTSRSAPQDLERGRAVGAQGYIVKGEFDQRVLLDRIRTLVG